MTQINDQGSGLQQAWPQRDRTQPSRQNGLIKLPVGAEAGDTMLAVPEDSAIVTMPHSPAHIAVAGQHLRYRVDPATSWSFLHPRHLALGGATGASVAFPGLGCEADEYLIQIGGNRIVVLLWEFDDEDVDLVLSPTAAELVLVGASPLAVLPFGRRRAAPGLDRGLLRDPEC